MQRIKRAFLYCRVSTIEQNTDAQEAEIKNYTQSRGWGVKGVFKDKASGAAGSRPALDQLMAQCKRGQADVVLVWKFDRFARSVSHLLSALQIFKDCGVEFVSVSEQIDTSTPTGKLVFTVLGAVSELERTLIAERTRLGLQQARRRGKILGRPAIRKLSAGEIEKVRQDRATGKFTLRRLAQKYGTSLWAIQQATAVPAGAL
jgi:DNA invertase Pin-like site-specific DNA recombinase